VIVADPDLPPAFADAYFSALKSKNEKKPSQLGRCKKKKMKKENGIERMRKDKRRKKQERRRV
jgi:hypothetical protein